MGREDWTEFYWRDESNIQRKGHLSNCSIKSYMDEEIIVTFNRMSLYELFITSSNI